MITVYKKPFQKVIKPPKIKNRGNYVVIEKPKQRDIETFITTDGSNPITNGVKLIGNIVNTKSIENIKAVNRLKRPFIPPHYSGVVEKTFQSSIWPEYKPDKIQEIGDIHLFTVVGFDFIHFTEDYNMISFIVKTPIENKSDLSIYTIDSDDQILDVETYIEISFNPETYTIISEKDISKGVDPKYLGWYIYSCSFDMSLADTFDYKHVIECGDNKIIWETQRHLSITNFDDDGSFKFKCSLNKVTELPNIEYSTDKVHWKKMNWHFDSTIIDEYDNTVSLYYSDILDSAIPTYYFRGNNPKGLSFVDGSLYDTSVSYRMVSCMTIGNSSLGISGDIGMFIDGKGGKDLILPPYCFAGLFMGAHIMGPVILKSEHLSEGCYMDLYCEAYFGQSSYCLHPLPVTELPKAACAQMFDSSNVYKGLNLKNITKLNTDSLTLMYCKCDNLYEIYCPSVAEWNTDYTVGWLSVLPALGSQHVKVYKPANLTIPISPDGIPYENENWEIIPYDE